MVTGLYATSRRPNPATGGVCVFFSRSKTAAEPAPVQERRRSIRHATVTQVAKLRLDARREELCLLRDISPEGARAEVYVSVEVGTHIEIELRTGHIIGGCIAWIDDKAIGVAFDEPMPMSAVLAHCSFDERLGNLRPPRLNVNMRGILVAGGTQRVVPIGNISQAGLQIASADPLTAELPCMIGIPGLEPRPATIRWWRYGEAGVMLTEPLEFAEFAEWRSLVAA